MAEIICIQAGWNGGALKLPPLQYRRGDRLFRAKFHKVSVAATDDYPLGRKGLVLARAWEQLGPPAKAEGMLVLDGDVAVDPVMVRQMMDAIDGAPGIVHTAPVKIWPVSTHRQDWVWAHWENRASQHIDDTASWFSFNFTYLPAALLAACIKRGMKKWIYPAVDANVSRTARAENIEARPVPDCFPVHLHWG